MIGKWLGKMKDYIFGDETETDTRDISKNNKATGRIISEHKSVEPKVLHRYPEGKFRFPVIPDVDRDKDLQSSKEKRKINHKPTPYNKKVHTIVKNETKREKFSGRNFKAQDIPSPVYGFGERTLYVKKDDNLPVSDEMQILQQDPAGFVEVNYEHQVTQNEASELTFEEQMPISYIDLNDGKENEVWDMDFPEDVKKIDQMEDEVPEYIEEISVSELELSSLEDELSGSEEELSSSGDELSGSQEESSRSETKLLESVQNTISSRDHDSKPVHEKRDGAKRTVPFNVLMLKQDKRNQRTNGNTYQFPPLHLMERPSYSADSDAEWLQEQQDLLQSTLENFNVKATVIGAVQGPAVTRLEVQPAAGVKVSKITNLSDDIKLSLAARDIRIEAPIPGRNAVGIEVPNLKSRPVPLREIIQTPEFKNSTSPLTVALGLDISGQPIVTDLQKMPHGLIAGATGSGKSVCINSILISLFYKADPDEVKLLLVDPKMVELAPYNRIPHLVTPVITDAKEATNALKWTVEEMERRYEEFSGIGVRDIKRFNQIAGSNGKKKLPYIVVIIDELADLMMVSPHDVEEAICRIAQKARACGIHLLLATQRPSVDVITGLIKANIPTRTAFSVSSQVDSRTIIDTSGAEKLLGKGDMLFLGNGSSKPQRIQGTFVSDEEIERITSFLRKQRQPEYLFEKEVLIQQNAFGDFEDDLFLEACDFILEQGAASSSALQRRFRIGFNRAARLIEMMEAQGIVSEAMGSKPRNVLISKEEYEEQVLNN
jgi:DNA segregation ATPase FtsK/SpoIIIE, S-DNA-T family